MHRIQSILNWIRLLRKLAPISSLSQELVKFDTQAMTHPEIKGAEYQQGTLAGYELKEYLLEKWGRQCCYCQAKEVPLEIEHVIPKSKGGSDRVSNLTLACRPCNQKKGNSTVQEFLKKNLALLAKILKQLKTPLKDAAAVNSTRWALFESLKNLGLALQVGSGGRTKFNRTQLKIPKDHALDAACVGNVDQIQNWSQPIQVIRCTGRGSYKRTRLTSDGFPRGYLMRKKSVHGFQTGDLVRAQVPKGVNQGIHQGRVAIRASGSFNIQKSESVIQGVSYKYCQLISRNKGYMITQIAKKKKDSRDQGHASHAALSLLDLKVEVSRALG
jgi:5-methylcytosine-specific restriction endonuclease McrA